MAQGEFDMYLCAGGGGYFALVNQHLLRGLGSEKENPEMIRGLPKNGRKK